MHSQLPTSAFKPFILQTIDGTFVEDIELECCYCAWHMSPTPKICGLLNWNISSYCLFDDVLWGIIKLKNETLVSFVGPCVAVPIALTQEEHNAMHSKLLDLQLENPHSFVHTPIHERIGDTDLPIRAILGTGTAWDQALINLLPKNVKGVQAIVHDACGQNFTYYLSGKDAIDWCRDTG